MNRLIFIRPESMPFIGAAFSCIFWILDSVIDAYIFNTHRLFFESLLDPESLVIWSRVQVIVLSTLR